MTPSEICSVYLFPNTLADLEALELEALCLGTAQSLHALDEVRKNDLT